MTVYSENKNKCQLMLAAKISSISVCASLFLQSLDDNHTGLYIHIVVIFTNAIPSSL